MGQSAFNSSFQMVDVGEKSVTRRRAIAGGKIILAPDAFRALVERTNPKGDVLALAEVAGIMAAKKTSDLIPLCHPLPIDQVLLRFEPCPEDFSVAVRCEVVTHAKTGVEMEALAGVNGALLTIYDLSKAVNPVLTISEIRLLRKEGGKSGVWVHPGGASLGRGWSEAVGLSRSIELTAEREAVLSGARVGLLTVSDRCARGETEDRSGALLLDAVRGAGGEVIAIEICADDPGAIRGAVGKMAWELGADLVLTTGGTGLGPRDLTPDALESLWTRRLPGVGEWLRARGSAQTPMSYLSRTEAGLIGKCLVVLLPGSPGAVRDGFATLAEVFKHSLHIIRGGGH